MTSLRDTSGDAMAAAMEEQSRERLGYNDAPVTLLGQDAQTLRVAMADAHALLVELEERTKIFREKQSIRTRRIVLGAALALIPAAKKSEPGK